MYVVDDKDTKFYNQISHAFVGRGVDCMPISALKKEKTLSLLVVSLPM